MSVHSSKNLYKQALKERLGIKVGTHNILYNNIKTSNVLGSHICV